MIPPTVKPVLAEDDAKMAEHGEDPMTSDQADMLRLLCEEAGEPFDTSLTQRQAMERIEYLRERTNSTQNL